MSAPLRHHTRPDRCADHDHPPVTYNPWMHRTWCLCGERTYHGNATADGPHMACCGGPLTEREEGEET